MRLLTAKPYLEAKKNSLETRIRNLKARGITPCLKVILVGEDPASMVYVEKKRTTASTLGLEAETLKLPSTLSVSELKTLVDHLNADPKVHGILIQRPLPPQFKENEVLEWVSAEKDVDGLHPTNLGRLAQGNPKFISCTPRGTIELLEFYGYSLRGKLCAVLGRSPIVGRPFSQLLLYKDATLIQVHSRTANAQELTRQADFVFVAIGKPKFVDRSYLKPGAVVIDVGIHRLPDGKLIGDVDFEDVKDHVSAITPVPGGVGPLTIDSLMENTILSAELAVGHV